MRETWWRPDRFAERRERLMARGRVLIAMRDFFAEAGFVDVTWYGNWDRTNVGPTSPEIVAIAR